MLFLEFCGISIGFSFNVLNIGKQDWYIRKQNLIGGFFFNMIWKFFDLMEMELVYISKYDWFYF